MVVKGFTISLTKIKMAFLIPAVEAVGTVFAETIMVEVPFLIDEFIALCIANPGNAVEYAFATQGGPEFVAGATTVLGAGSAGLVASTAALGYATYLGGKGIVDALTIPRTSVSSPRGVKKVKRKFADTGMHYVRPFKRFRVPRRIYRKRK